MEATQKRGLEKKRHIEESRFRKAFAENTKKVMKGADCHATEYPLFAAGDMIKREFYEHDEEMSRKIRTRIIGRVDVFFRYHGHMYAGEIKYQPYEGNDFWDALKCVGYANYMNWQNALIPDWEKVRPAILMPKSRIKLEHRIVASALKILLIAIEPKDDTFTAEAINED